jgi:hypothetical protein
MWMRFLRFFVDALGCGGNEAVEWHDVPREAA